MQSFLNKPKVNQYESLSGQFHMQTNTAVNIRRTAGCMYNAARKNSFADLFSTYLLEGKVDQAKILL